eukprot:scaffold83395_cov51-Attheya_sp.AAC.1
MRKASSSAAADATDASAEQRPVYIRRNQRQAKKKPKFFHGAFSGGYSAGYHNTVGSKEGWKPSEGAINKVQTVQDYMDEEDAQDWGGPRHVRDDYQNADELRQGALHTLQQQHQQTQSSSSSAAVFPGPVPREFMEASVASSTIDPVGKRLLRKLGWRGDGRSVAFVENDNNNNDESKQHDTTQSESHQAAYLSKRKMRKIKLASQASCIQIPPPKLDLYGMGYEPFANAPEFRAHKEKRRERAEQRAREATTNSKRDTTRYHTSHILDDDEKEEEHHTEQSFGTTPSSAVNSGVALETTEDFVGNKTVGGFALHDDADDVYDAPVSGPEHQQQKSSEYHSEIVEPDEDSDVEQEQHGGLMGASSATSFFARSKEKPNMGIADLAGALSSWAGTDGKATKDSASFSAAVVTTSDGRPPLPGFILGGGGGDSASSAMERFPGPDLPDNYRLSRHVFKDFEQQAFIRQQSLAVKQESLQQKKVPVVPAPSSHPPMGDIRKKLDSKTGPDVNEPMAGTRFASLATAMQNRFTASTNVFTTTEESTPKSGLVSSNDIKSGKDPKDETRSEPPKKIVVKRTVISWVPSSLLCKRLHMKNVAVSQKNPSLQSNSSKGQSEQSYFEQQVLGAAKIAAPHSVSDVTKSTVPKKQNEWDSFNNEMETLETKEERPPLDLFKAIFEPDSESSSESEASDSDGEKEGQADSSRAPADTSTEAPLGITKEDDNLNENVNDEMVRSEKSSKEGRDAERSSRSRNSAGSSTDHKSSRREKKERHSDRKKHPDRKRSRRYSDSDSDSDRRHRKHGRRDRKKEEKKKKKRH